MEDINYLHGNLPGITQFDAIIMKLNWSIKRIVSNNDIRQEDGTAKPIV